MKARQMIGYMSPTPRYVPSAEYQLILDKAAVYGYTLSTQNYATSVGSYGVDGAAIIQFGDFVYRLGGWNDSQSPKANSKVYRSNSIATSLNGLQTWTALADAPWGPRHSFGRAVIGNKLVIWGADSSINSGGVNTHDCWSATQDAAGVLTWTFEANLGYSARLIAGYPGPKDGYLYTIGGETDGQGTPGTGPMDVLRSNDFWHTYETVATGLSQFNINLAGSAVWVGNDLYTVAGGFYKLTEPFTQTYTASVWKSSDNGATWTQLGDMPNACQYTATVEFDNKLFAMYGVGTLPTDIYFMDSHQNWYTPSIANLPPSSVIYRHAVSRCKVTVLGVQYLVWGFGSDNFGTGAQNDINVISSSQVGYEPPSDAEIEYQDTYLMKPLVANGRYAMADSIRYFGGDASEQFRLIDWKALDRFTKVGTVTFDQSGATSDGVTGYLYKAFTPNHYSRVDCGTWVLTKTVSNDTKFDLSIGSAQSFTYSAYHYGGPFNDLYDGDAAHALPPSRFKGNSRSLAGSFVMNYDGATQAITNTAQATNANTPSHITHCCLNYSNGAVQQGFTTRTQQMGYTGGAPGATGLESDRQITSVL